ncbi:stage II sporulation protein M [Cohnella massiliensis]|uniref:stage II sporulation protein M n=1 Tax=Cohnella massiliensis TaxID=1816691 RepID=UPI00159376FA|nr:stage II sporulation protein M [Cohnella massiliensis]
MFSRTALLQTWKNLRRYFIFAAILFFASVVVGGSQTSLPFLDEQMKAISEMANEASSSDNPQWSFFTTIFFNNVRSVVLAMYFGIVLCMMPVFTLVLNGMLLGYLFGGIADQGFNIWPMIAKSILPHGIVEFLALFLACGMGIYLGFSAIKSFWGSLIGKDKPWSGFVFALKGSVPTLIAIVLLLLLAAVIESTFTYWLTTNSELA